VRPGKVKGGGSPSVACDHFLRAPDDIRLMSDLGLQAYRFSVSWSRVFPKGTEREPLEAGLAFYERLVERLLEVGIEPWVTLYHWDLPLGLENAGGWPVRETVDAYLRFVDVVSRRLGDRVSRWITVNEPWTVSMMGYQTGRHAPGRTSWPAALAASHHVLLAHGRAVSILRANSPDAAVGIALNVMPAYPASSSLEDRAAAVQFDGYVNRWFLDPLYGRGYPEDMIQDYVRQGYIPASGLREMRPGDLEAIATPCDFLGVNYFTRAVIGDKGSDRSASPSDGPKTLESTDNGWEIAPKAMSGVLQRLWREYPGIPFYITANGAAFNAVRDVHGRVPDARRVAFLYAHLHACWEAIQAGVPVRGYFVWSLLDQFEWHEGYSQRFGLVHVDQETQERRLKDSALWYRLVIRGNALMSHRK
jgi:beta-glucosidase